jgi:hypothetical protein
MHVHARVHSHFHKRSHRHPHSTSTCRTFIHAYLGCELHIASRYTWLCPHAQLHEKKQLFVSTVRQMIMETLVKVGLAEVGAHLAFQCSSLHAARLFLWSAVDATCAHHFSMFTVQLEQGNRRGGGITEQ